jgi:hypothetical protein
MNAPRRSSDDQDSKRIFRYIAIVAAALILGTILLNVFWLRGPDPQTKDMPAAPEAPRTAPRPEPKGAPNS